MKNLKKHFTPNIFFILYVGTAVIASLLKIIYGREKFNNFLIFKNSFLNLIHLQPLYILHPEIHFDYYKYSPAFAMMMFPFSVFPDWLGAIVWNLLNVFVFVTGIKSLKLPEKQTVFILAFCFVEQLTSIQNFQSNLLVAGLMIHAFSFLGNGKLFFAAVFISVAFYIKLFGAVIGLAFLFYKNKLKFLVYGILVAALLFFLPDFLTNFSYLKLQYSDWINLLRHDEPGFLNYSVQTFFNTIFHSDINPFIYTLIGLVFLSVSLFVSKFQSQKNKNSFSHFRLLFLSNVLIWTVIFNHKAESPTFVIAVAGMAILFSFQTQNKNWIYFMIVAFVLTSLSSTDLFPRFVREEFIKPWRLKAFPAIALWFFIQIAFLRSLFFKKEINLSSPVLLNQRNGYTQ